jgi:hypothetical protein
MSLEGIMRLDNTRARRLALAKLYRNSRRHLARSSRVEESIPRGRTIVSTTIRHFAIEGIVRARLMAMLADHTPLSTRTCGSECKLPRLPARSLSGGRHCVETATPPTTCDGQKIHLVESQAEGAPTLSQRTCLRRDVGVQDARQGA